jgi:beta-lactam-binding protein with PASTA domain
MTRRRHGRRGYVPAPEAASGSAPEFPPDPAPAPPPDERLDPRTVALPEPAAAGEESPRDAARAADLPADSRIEPNAVALGETPPARPRRHRVAIMVSTFSLAMLAFFTGLLLFNNLIMPQLIHGTSEVKVPDLANLTFEQAEKEVSAAGLQLSRAGERFDPSVPSGFILSQDPPEGTPVRGRKRIMVVVSLGEEFSSVPEVFGESLRGARLLIERAGLAVGGLTRAPSEEVGEGLIAGTDPPAESVLPRGTPVGLLVSTGAGEELFMMPDLLGREIGGVRRQLEALGFRVVTPPAVPSIGGIVFQDPAPGSRITRDATIMLQATGRIIR